MKNNELNLKSMTPNLCQSFFYFDKGDVVWKSLSIPIIIGINFDKGDVVWKSLSKFFLL
jgi:hypothetical protein